MQNVVIEKPYEFVPPHRGNWWPSFIQQFRLIDRYLFKTQGLVDWEVRHADRVRKSLDAGHGVLLAPNHCRPCDAIVIGWLARVLRTHVYAMASWHLFHQDKFTAWAIRKMGGFSVYREGIDRKAISTAIEILETAERPLILFPEGAVSRTNERLHALLDGVAFIARSAAKKRARSGSGQVVIHPIALKYEFLDDVAAAVDPVLTEIEHRLTWRPQRHLDIMQRITKVGMALLSLKEAEHMGRPQIDKFATRLERLVDHLLTPLEVEWLGVAQSGPVVPRVKGLRMRIMPEMIQGQLPKAERDRRWRQLEDLYLAQQLSSYPPDYLASDPSPIRMLETVERFEEDITDRVRVYGRMKVVITADEPIVVSPERDRNAEVDPLMIELERRLTQLISP